MSNYVICNSVRLNNPACRECPHSLPHYDTHLFGTTSNCTDPIWCHDDNDDPKAMRLVKCIPYNEKLDGAFDMHYDRLYRMFKEDRNVSG